jgi:glutamyl-tRNA reductase
MSILAFGINHKSASVDLREKIAFAPEIVVETLQTALESINATEIALLSTCNRTEIYLQGEVSDEELLAWLAMTKGLEFERLQSCYYCYRVELAFGHMMRVACGLDSLVLGEPQIFGQIKSAYSVGREAETVSTYLNQAFQQAFSAAKRVRSETAIGQNPVSVAYASVSLAEQIFSDLNSAHALLIGAGETVELVARHLQEKILARLPWPTAP